MAENYGITRRATTCYVGTPEGVLRGGSFNNNDNNLRSANRNNNNPTNQNNNIGFRCARLILKPESGTPYSNAISDLPGVL